MTSPKIKNVAILGAGAVGAYFAASFSAAPGLSASLIARGPRRERLQRDGLLVNGQPYHLPVIHPDDENPPLDLIIVALKHHHLEAALPDLQGLVGDQTVILSVMNGLDSEALIGALYGMDRVLYGISVGIDALRTGNQVTYSQPGKHFFGEATNQPLSPQVRRVQAAFEVAGIAYETPPDMIRIMWWKFMVNVGMNQASAVMRAPYGVFQTSPPARDLMKALMGEVIDLAAASDVDLSKEDITEWDRFLATLSPQGKTSMLQDIEAGRQTEVDIFGGKVVRLGQELGISTAVNRTVFQIIQVLESKP